MFPVFLLVWTARDILVWLVDARSIVVAVGSRTEGEILSSPNLKAFSFGDKAVFASQ